MKKLLALLLTAVMLLSVCAFAQADALSDLQAKGKIRIGANIEFPPYEFYYADPETGVEEIAGFDMALARGIGEELGLEIEIVDQAFAGLITALNAGDVDMLISGLAVKPERQEVVDFSIPYFAGEQIMLMTRENADKLKTVEDMKGKRVGAQMGSLQAQILEEQFPDSEGFLIGEPSILALDLVQGNIDGWLITDLVAKQYIAAYADKVELVICDVPVVYDNTAGIAVAVAKGDNASLLEIINAYITRVKEDGTFDSWVDTAAAQAASLLETAE
ncbi:MAG: transporter substrate-binding domain-containing protein [Clostridia bacterium]|nr:transporter substrate-binding domain-containing protein [Clostridia bacterium]